MPETLNVEQDIRDLIAEILEEDDPQSFAGDANFIKDLGMDSMMALEILASIEKKYKIRIPEDDLPKITTINKAIELAKKYVN